MTRETWRAPRLAAVAGALLGVLGLTAATATADEWGQRTAGKHVYDAAGVLSAQQDARAMRPHLASGDLTGAVSAALTRVEGDLRANVAITPRPAPSVLEQAADVGGPLIGGAIAIAAVLIFGIIGFSGRWFGGFGGPHRTRVTGDDRDPTGWSGWSGGDGGASSGSSSGGGSF